MAVIYASNVVEIGMLKERQAIAFGLLEDRENWKEHSLH